MSYKLERRKYLIQPLTNNHLSFRKNRPPWCSLAWTFGGLALPWSWVNPWRWKQGLSSDVPTLTSGQGLLARLPSVRVVHLCLNLGQSYFGISVKAHLPWQFRMQEGIQGRQGDYRHRLPPAIPAVGLGTPGEGLVRQEQGNRMQQPGHPPSPSFPSEQSQTKPRRLYGIYLY